MKPVALVAALELEASALARRLDREARAPAGITVRRGLLGEVPILLAVGGVGKVAAASATQYLCDTFEVAGVIGFGLAGAMQATEPGHVVVATGALQHDFDARPLTADKGEVAADTRLTDALMRAAQSVAGSPQRVTRGIVLTGDRIVAATEVRDRLARDFPQAACIDMETAAVAQTAWRNGVAWSAVRVTSDSADESFDVDEVMGFGAGSAAELFARIIGMAVQSLK